MLDAKLKTEALYEDIVRRTMSKMLVDLLSWEVAEYKRRIAGDSFPENELWRMNYKIIYTITEAALLCFECGCAHHFKKGIVLLNVITGKALDHYDNDLQGSLSVSGALAAAIHNEYTLHAGSMMFDPENFNDSNVRVEEAYKKLGDKKHSEASDEEEDDDGD